MNIARFIGPLCPHCGCSHEGRALTHLGATADYWEKVERCGRRKAYLQSMRDENAVTQESARQ